MICLSTQFCRIIRIENMNIRIENMPIFSKLINDNFSISLVFLVLSLQYQNNFVAMPIISRTRNTNYLGSKFEQVAMCPLIVIIHKFSVLCVGCLVFPI